jgi:guanosine-3',5'-bis(diphosphate) 3'-pyrophosphohydrolase
MKETANDIQLLVRAIAFASEKHSSQRRKDAAESPYINHPIALVDVLANEGNVTNIETLCPPPCTTPLKIPFLGA